MSTATPPQARPLAEICADALRADCGHCWPGPGRPCDCPGGMHIARFARAERRGVISGADMAAALAGLGASGPGAVHCSAAVPA